MVGGRQLAVGGGWRLAVGGGWWLAIGGPSGLSFRAVLDKQKLGFLRTVLGGEGWWVGVVSHESDEALALEDRSNNNMSVCAGRTRH